MGTRGGASQERSLTSGVLYGLSAASPFLTGNLPRPKAPTEGIASDWQAIGQDMDSAIRRHDR